MEDYLEKKFSEFLETKAADSLFESFQSAVKQAFIEGVKSGEKITIQVVYIKNKKDGHEYFRQ